MRSRRRCIGNFSIKNINIKHSHGWNEWATGHWGVVWTEGRWKASDLCQQLLTEWWLKCWCPTAPPWAADNSRARRPPPRRSPATGWPSGTAGSRRRCSPSRRFRRCTRKSPCRSVKRENKNYIREFVFDKSLKPTSTEILLNFIWEILKNVWGVKKPLRFWNLFYM